MKTISATFLLSLGLLHVTAQERIDKPTNEARVLGNVSEGAPPTRGSDMPDRQNYARQKIIDYTTG